MSGYVLLRSEKGSDLTPAEVDNNQKNLYDFKAEKTEVDAVEVRTDALEASQAAQDAALSALGTRTDALDVSRTAQDTELADWEARIDEVEAGLASHGHEAADVGFTPSGDVSAAGHRRIEWREAGQGRPDAPLDAGGKLPVAYLPDMITAYKGYFPTVPDLVAA
jgi:hypothetical protein